MQSNYKYLKFLPESILKKLFELSNLTENEYWVLYHSVIKNRMVENICLKLSISASTYRNIKNTALAKVDLTFQKHMKTLTF